LSTSLEKIIPALTNYFGDFTDVNGDDRVTAVFSDKVGAAASGLLGYVSPLNLFPKTDCAASDEMEIFFGRTPDASLPYDELAPILPPLLAHELTHVIQGRRVDLTATDFDGAFAGYMERWLAEGQAQLGQEVAGYALGGRGPGNNYGAAVARGRQNGAAWYEDSFLDLATYFRSGPSACSWWARNPSPCLGRPLYYGVSWSFLRWVSDQYGSGHVGGESGLHQAIMDTRSNVGELLAGLTGESFETLLANWGATLFLDEGVASGRNVLPSWNLREVLNSFNVRILARLIPSDNRLDRVALGSSLYLYGGRGASSASRAVEFEGIEDLPSDIFSDVDGTAAIPMRLQIFVRKMR